MYTEELKFANKPEEKLSALDLIIKYETEISIDSICKLFRDTVYPCIIECRFCLEGM